jgi:hypothetical protein
MEIQGVGSSQSIFAQKQTSLSDEQKATLEEILAKYDSENLSDEDAKALMDELKAAGIPPCKDTFEIMKAEGFTPPKPPEGQGPPPPPPSDGSNQTSSLTSEQKTQLMDLIEQLKNGEISEDSFLTTLNQMASSGLLSSGSVINQTV